MRVPLVDVIVCLRDILAANGFTEPASSQLAEVFAHNSRDGVASHGLDRFPEFIDSVRRGLVDPRATALCVEQVGASWERWNGHRAAGPLSALACIDRSIALAASTGVGVVALRETNHWMRAGAYGARAAMRGYVALCFGNTAANMVAWGGAEAKLGNNPLVVAIPNGSEPIVLDMAMTQYSFGRLAAHAREHRPLAVAGGFDAEGHLSTDAESVQRTGRLLPIGYWKGSGLALALDLLAALLSRGRATFELDAHAETGTSQVFIVFDVQRTSSSELPFDPGALIDAVLADFRYGGGDAAVLYPGERAAQARAEAMVNGVQVHDEVWAQICGMGPTQSEVSNAAPAASATSR